MLPGKILPPQNGKLNWIFSITRSPPRSPKLNSSLESACSSPSLVTISLPSLLFSSSQPYDHHHLQNHHSHHQIHETEGVSPLLLFRLKSSPALWTSPDGNLMIIVRLWSWLSLPTHPPYKLLLLFTLVLDTRDHNQWLLIMTPIRHGHSYNDPLPPHQQHLSRPPPHHHNHDHDLRRRARALALRGWLRQERWTTAL